MKYDETVPFYLTKSEALAKVGLSVRAKVDIATNTAAHYPIPEGTPGTVVNSRPVKKKVHRRWAVDIGVNSTKLGLPL